MQFKTIQHQLKKLLLILSIIVLQYWLYVRVWNKSWYPSKKNSTSIEETSLPFGGYLFLAKERWSWCRMWVKSLYYRMEDSNLEESLTYESVTCNTRPKADWSRSFGLLVQYSSKKSKEFSGIGSVWLSVNKRMKL